ncbi:MAG: hypothetical protein IJB67_00200 [Firmicutes bacterium]|nr:hypothetical protein [Bacillota bacterium]
MSLLQTLFGEATVNPFLQNLRILPVFLDIAMVICSFNLLSFLYRVIKGPAMADRAIAMDSCGVTVMSLIVIYSIRQGTSLYMSCAMVIAVLGFIGMVGLSKYIQGGNIVASGNIVLNREEAEDLQNLQDPKVTEELQKKAAEARQKAAANYIPTARHQRKNRKRHHKK